MGIMIRPITGWHPRRLWLPVVCVLVAAWAVLGAGAALAATSPPRPFVYVADGSGVSVIDTATNTVVATIPVSDGANAVAITPDGAYAYVVGDGGVSVIDTATEAVLAMRRSQQSPSQRRETPRRTNRPMRRSST
jgi:YVTN family beta-propeller protein